MKQRTLYLVRHGKVAFPGGERRCIGRTDLKLSEEGEAQARALAHVFRDYGKDGLTVYTSPLVRAVRTAELLSGGRFPVIIKDGLQELDMGEWENMPLSQIKKTLESEPEGGETRAAGLRRFQTAVSGILKESSGDIVCVAHAGINCCFLSFLLGTPLETSRGLRQPYGGFSRIEIRESEAEGDKETEKVEMRVVSYGIMPQNAPDEETCGALFERYRTPENIRRHCRMVQKKAIEIGKELNRYGAGLDLKLISASALLHDILRTEPDHAKQGAAVLDREGYPEAADIIRRHHDFALDEAVIPDGLPGEADVVYLADKLVCGEKEVTLEERFRLKMERFEREGNDTARRHCMRRFAEAKAVEKKIRGYTG